MNQNILAKFKNSERFFICPICGEEFTLQGKSLLCNRKHCFDISHQGYINFTLNLKKQKYYDKESFKNRKFILERGFYSPILNEIITTLENTSTIHTILDAGCGEGYYSRQIEMSTKKKVIGFDISKDAIQLAAKANRESHVNWFVGDLTHLPLKTNCIDCILNIFSPANYKEFKRVLKNKGILIKVIPGKHHFKEFRERAKEQLKNEYYSNQKTIEYLNRHFSIFYKKRITLQYRLSSEEAMILSVMTPILFQVDRTSLDLTNIDYLTIDAELLFGQC